MLSEILLSSLSTLMTSASAVSPMERYFDGCFGLGDQSISETCTNPSMPSSSSTKTP